MRSIFDVTPEEREAIFLSMPSPVLYLANFHDIMTDEKANAIRSTDFIAGRITVKDPAVADILIPKDHGFGMKAGCRWKPTITKPIAGTT